MAYTPLTLTCNGKFSVPFQPGITRIWTYQTGDAKTTVDGANYFSDGYRRGMQAGDIICVVVMSAGVPSTMHWSAVMASTASDVDIADGSAMTLTDSD